MDLMENENDFTIEIMTWVDMTVQKQ